MVRLLSSYQTINSWLDNWSKLNNQPTLVKTLGPGTFPTRFSYCLILGSSFWECPHPRDVNRRQNYYGSNVSHHWQNITHFPQITEQCKQTNRKALSRTISSKTGRFCKWNGFREKFSLDLQLLKVCKCMEVWNVSGEIVTM
jgi:hypothetical protein